VCVCVCVYKIILGIDKVKYR